MLIFQHPFCLQIILQVISIGSDHTIGSSSCTIGSSDRMVWVRDSSMVVGYHFIVVITNVSLSLPNVCQWSEKNKYPI